MSPAELTDKASDTPGLTKLNILAGTAAGINLSSVKSVIGSLFSLGVGQAVSTFSSLIFFAYISRHFGVELLGIVALALTIATYVTLGTDQGLRLIGARLVARESSAAQVIIRRILLKRLLSCALCVTIGCLYALWGPVPRAARAYIVGFVLAVIPYAFSLDWLAWGLNKFAWLGGFNGGTRALFLIGSVTGILLTRTTFLPITLANGIAATVGSLAMWGAWRLRWKGELSGSVPVAEELIQRELRWAAVLPLGVTTILSQAFNNFDTVMLGAMSTTSELGRYSAAYKILFLILGAYWLVMSSVYPKLSRARTSPAARKALFITVALVAVVGGLLAIVVSAFAPGILRTLYGGDLQATNLLRVLVWALPMDFCVALLSVVFVSRGHDRALLVATAGAAGSDIILNLLLIPKFQARGAALATLASYAYFLVFLLQYTIRKPVFAEAIAQSSAI